ncbi:NADP-dependent oxidoreductase domain-containing protein [Diplogelasinospora grovesii]|uniref:NADP-dependent oxidoreductase domain-containing protein n=1 Tax=Diplogelasinospora grovesii TaxID=303347 RepID=A0AAN6RYL3_9PEZI|nr:NADP-dependent oxidoreductase domain-containing protein [Diplogelasinospora grovesii]
MPPNLIFGAGSIGATANGFIYGFDTPAKVSELLEALHRLNVRELDSAASYPVGNPGNTEVLLGQAGAVEEGFVIDSKVAAHIPAPTLDDKAIGASIDRTLTLLNTPKIRTLYVHAPDPKTPLEITAAAFHRQHLAGKFERLGLCNYKPTDVDRYFRICEERGYVKPAVYQGQYNALFRSAEKELIPLLRRNGCAFYAYSPLAGGFLTGKVTFAASGNGNDGKNEKELDRTRWRGETTFAAYSRTYDTPAMHDAIRKLKAVCDATEQPMSLQEVALRWLVHHSALRQGDGIILGAKRIEQLEGNVAGARKGPLEGDVLQAVEGLWATVRKNKEGKKKGGKL